MHGDPVLILPGLLCGGDMFAETLAAIPSAVIVDDFYGHAATLAAMAQHALDRAPPRFALLGHSMGARIALEVMRLAPERVTRLALADTGIHNVQPGERQKREALSALGHEQGFDALLDQWLPPMVGPHHRGNTALMARLRRMCHRAGLATYDRQIAALLARPDPADIVSAIACPTFVIVGADDAWSPVAQHEDIAARIKNAHLRIIAQAGHMLPAEDPAAFITVVREWLAMGVEAPPALRSFSRRCAPCDRGTG